MNKFLHPEKIMLRNLMVFFFQKYADGTDQFALNVLNIYITTINLFRNIQTSLSMAF